MKNMEASKLQCKEENNSHEKKKLNHGSKSEKWEKEITTKRLEHFSLTKHNHSYFKGP